MNRRGFLLLFSLQLSLLLAACGSTSDQGLTRQGAQPLQSTSGSSTAADAALWLFGGFWQNNDPTTRGITRIEISTFVTGSASPDAELVYLTAHPFGKCSPSECDLGSRTQVYDNSGRAVFDFSRPGFADTLTVTPQDAEGTTLQAVRSAGSDRISTTTSFFHRSVARPASLSLARETILYGGATWVNTDRNTRGITRIKISNAGGVLVVHPYGQCSPTDCDWGEQYQTYQGNPFTITFSFPGGLTESLTLSLIEPDHHVIQLHVVKQNNRGQVATYDFARL